MKFHRRKPADPNLFRRAVPAGPGAPSASTLERLHEHALTDSARAYERKIAGQVMWDALGILGFDQDGDKTPAAMLAPMGWEGFCKMFLEFVKEHRADDDEVMADLSA